MKKLRILIVVTYQQDAPRAAEEAEAGADRDDDEPVQATPAGLPDHAYIRTQATGKHLTPAMRFTGLLRRTRRVQMAHRPKAMLIIFWVSCMPCKVLSHNRR